MKSLCVKLDIKEIFENEIVENADDWIVDVQDIQMEEEIGSGNSCIVYKGKWKGLKVAVKKMKLKDRSNAFKEFIREISTLVRLKPHTNTVSLIGVGQEKDEFFILTEFCGGGTLFDLLHSTKTIQLNWSQRIKICKDIAEGMAYLHSIVPPIIHRDLKSLNLLMDQPIKRTNINDINVKIADFGLSRLQDTTHMTEVLGTFVHIYN